jgi:superfamily II DNA or RNA helicase
MLREGQVLTGHQFNEPMRVETVRADGADTWVVGLVGQHSRQFRRVTLTRAELETLQIHEATTRFDGDGRLLRLGLEAVRLAIAYEFDPYFALSISRVDPLPHQLDAVYNYLLKLGRVRFLLADDAGAGKTVMAGLLLRELKLRGLVERTLVVCPANLTFQWQRELKEKFNETFVVLKGGDIREQFGVNQWLERPQVITSLDLAKREDILPGLRQVHWDLVVIDEAHRMSAADPDHKTQRYRLGELLRDTSDHLLLLTATPHKGDPDNFCFFLQLLDQDAFADVRSIREAMAQRRAPFYLRRTKEAMVYFPEQRPDGTWVVRPIFTRRIPHTVTFSLDGDEFALYRDVTRYVKRHSAAAAAAAGQGDPRARAVGFLMALYQRRLASSTYALRRSLENRIARLTESLERALEVAREAPAQLPDAVEWDEMEDADRERLERTLAAVHLARNADQVREQIAELERLVAQARAVEAAGSEAKLATLRELLRREGFFDHPDQRLLIFTEFKDTLDYLVERLRAWGFRVGFIHGGMAPGSRDEPGTRLYVEQQFREGAVQILVATEAAGEGINLQVCHIMVNYDIPWNPNRLEQRMGRIHRYGQTRDCLIFNFVAQNTVEGHVLHRLLDKLQQIRDALDDDAVFNVVGEVLSPAHIERVLRDYYAGRLGETDLEERILEDVEEDRFRAICQNALEGLATRNLNLELLVERRALARARRIVPETLLRFLREAAPYVPFTLREVPSLPYTFDVVGTTPPALRRLAQTPDWRYGTLAHRYPRCTTDRETAERHHLEWVTPGHPLFEAVRLHIAQQAQAAFRQGACYASLAHDRPVRLDFYRARVVDGLGQVVRETLVAVELDEDGSPRPADPALLGNLLPVEPPAELPTVAEAPEATAWLHDTVLRPLLEQVRAERAAEVERVARHVELSLTELIARADELVGRFQEAVERGDEGARGLLAQAEARQQELLDRRRRRREELERQKSLTLQDVERIASVLVLPHPERASPELVALRPDPEVEAIAMQVAITHERAAGRQVEDVHARNLGYDLTSVDPRTGEVRLIEVKGLSGAHGRVLLTPNERRVAEDRRDCYWLYVVTDCRGAPRLHAVADPACFPWHEVTRVEHYWLDLTALAGQVQVREAPPPYGAAP